MKEILGHRTRSRGEIVEILARGGTYTCPTLPHDRYGRVKQACRELRRLGLVPAKSRSDLRGVTGRTPVAVNLAPTPLFREWRRAHAAGETALGPVRRAKVRRAGSPVEHSDTQAGPEACSAHAQADRVPDRRGAARRRGRLPAEPPPGPARP